MNGNGCDWELSWAKLNCMHDNNAEGGCDKQIEISHVLALNTYFVHIIFCAVQQRSMECALRIENNVESIISFRQTFQCFSFCFVSEFFMLKSAFQSVWGDPGSSPKLELNSLIVHLLLAFIIGFWYFPKHYNLTVYQTFSIDVQTKLIGQIENKCRHFYSSCWVSLRCCCSSTVIPFHMFQTQRVE